jgi:hypothetical protein
MCPRDLWHLQITFLDERNRQNIKKKSVYWVPEGVKSSTVFKCSLINPDILSWPNLPFSCQAISFQRDPRSVIRKRVADGSQQPCWQCYGLSKELRQPGVGWAIVWLLVCILYMLLKPADDSPCLVAPQATKLLCSQQDSFPHPFLLSFC